MSNKKHKKQAPYINKTIEPLFDLDTVENEVLDNDEASITVPKKTKCPVVSYNKYSNVIVFEYKGTLMQTNDYNYDGSGFIEWE